MLKSADMNYPAGFMVSEAKPAGGFALKIIIAVAIGSVLALGIYLLASGDKAGAWFLLAEALFVLAVFWAVFPRSYQIYEDRIRIVLGALFSINIPFEDIEKVEVSSMASFTINFATAFTTRYILIKKRRGMGIVITPASNELFAEEAGAALARWRETQPG
jgi:hypothetical protein